MEEQNVSWFGKYLSEATFLALLSFGAYLIAYAYDYRYLTYYKVSPEVIRISLESFLLVFLILSFVLMLVWFSN